MALPIPGVQTQGGGFLYANITHVSDSYDYEYEKGESEELTLNASVDTGFILKSYTFTEKYETIYSDGTSSDPIINTYTIQLSGEQTQISIQFATIYERRYYDTTTGELQRTNRYTIVGNVIVQSEEVAPPTTYTITTSSRPANGGTTTGGGTFNYGDTCEVVATANNGAMFLRWEENGSEVYPFREYSFTVRGNRTLVAVFHVFTDLILRSNSSGKILRASNGKILRDD